MPAPLLATILALALSGLAPLIVVSVTPEGSSLNWPGPWLIAAGAGLRFAWIMGSRRRRLFEMVVWLFVYVFLGVAPMIQMRVGENTDTTPNIDHSLDWQATTIVLVGCAAFFLGVVMVKWKIATAEPLAAARVEYRRTNLLTAASLALFAYYGSKVGFGHLFTDRTTLDTVRGLVWPDRTTGALITGATSMGLLVSAIAQIYAGRQRKLDGERRPFFLTLVSVLALFTCVNPVNSARYVCGTVILALLASLGAYSSVKRFRTISLSALIGMVYLFPIADMFRRSLDPSAKSQNPLESMLSGDFDSFSQITNSAEYVAYNGIAWGHQLLGVVFFWVPRSAWPDKATDTGSLLAEWKLYSFKNLSAPLWAEFYINGGFVLLALGMFAFGLLVARLDLGTEAVLLVTGRPSVLACILPFYLLIVLRGSLLQAVAFMAVVIVASLFVRERTGKQMPPAGARHTTMRPDARRWETTS